MERGGEKAQLFWLGIFRPMGSNAPVTAASFAARVRRQKSPTRSQGRFQVRSWQPLQAVCRLDAHRSSASAAAGALATTAGTSRAAALETIYSPLKPAGISYCVTPPLTRNISTWSPHFPVVTQKAKRRDDQRHTSQTGACRGHASAQGNWRQGPQPEGSHQGATDGSSGREKVPVVGLEPSILADRARLLIGMPIRSRWVTAEYQNNLANSDMMFLSMQGPRVASSDWLVRWEGSVSASAVRVAEELRRKQYVVIFLFSLFYWLATCLRASRKLFWLDELFTVYVSRLPDMASVWSALKQGVDFNPPLFYVVTRLSESLFGEGHIATRLPAILGFWIFCLCLFRFVSVRTSVLAGLISMLFPLVTTAYFYAYEARSHGIVLGFGGLALVCWQTATGSRRRGWWLIGLSVALLCAILIHTYAILLLVPFVLAELVRSVILRSVDWAVWLAMIFSSLGATVSLPLFRAAKATFPAGGFFSANGSILTNSYQFHLTPAVGVLSAGLILYFVFKFASPNPPVPPNGRQSVELPEVVALIAFVAMPFFSFFVAKLTGAPFMLRYSISTVAGFGCLFGMATAKRPPVGLGVLLVLVAQIEINFFKYSQSAALIEPITSIGLSTSAEAFAYQYQMMRAVPNKGSPIVLLDNLEFLPIIHYAPAELASRLVYLVKPDSDINGECYLRLQRLFRAPGRLERREEFLSTHDVFIAHCKSRSIYLLNDFIREGADVRVESISGDSFLFSVTFKKNPGASAETPLH